MLKEFKNFMFLIKLYNKEYKVEATRRITQMR